MNDMFPISHAETELRRNSGGQLCRRAFACVLLALGLSAASHEALAQPYSIKWSSFASGGGTSTGHGYSLNGSFGQPDAGGSAGGVYSLAGGFWSVVAVVSADDAPTLRILPQGQSIILAWPDPSTDFQLQQSSSLSVPNWSDVAVAPAVIGTEKQVTMPLKTGNQFFRLRRP